MDQRIQKHGGNRNSALKPRPAGSNAPPQPLSSSAPFAKAPPRRELTRNDIRRWQRDSAWSPTSSEDSFRPPLLRTLPPKDASPEKSSLRPATKPRTPGRVVEFTSSVLSPPEQELARQKRREREADVEEFAETLRLSQSMSLAFDRDDNRREPPLFQQGTASQQGRGSSQGQENQRPSSSSEIADVSMQDASPLEARASQPVAAAAAAAGAALSQTQWSRQHWIALERMVQIRRERLEAERSERRLNRLIGKFVRARDVAMRIECWHLDCVEEFQTQVGGWQDADLVKRVFGLLVGERVRKARRALREARLREERQRE